MDNILNTEVQTTDTSSSVDLSALQQLLLSVTNEDGQPKYRTLEDGLNALKHSQEYIPTLKKELEERERVIQELKQQQEQQDLMQKLLEEVNLLKQTETQQPVEQPPVVPPASTDQGVDVSELVAQELARQQRAQTELLNSQRVENELVKRYGDIEKARQAFAARAQSLGMGPQQIADIAKTSPDAALTLLLPAQGTPSVQPIIGGQTPVTQASNNTDISRHFQGIKAGSMKDMMKAVEAARYELTNRK